MRRDNIFTILREMISFHNIIYRLLKNSGKLDFRKLRLIESVYKPLYSKTNRLSDKVLKTVIDVRNEFIVEHRDEINNLYFDNAGNLLKNNDTSLRLRKRRLVSNFLGELNYRVHHEFKVRLKIEFETMDNQKMVDFFKEYDYYVDKLNDKLYGNKMAISLLDKLIDDEYIPNIEGLTSVRFSYNDRPVLRRVNIGEYDGSYKKVEYLSGQMEKTISVKIDDHRIQDFLETLSDDRNFDYFIQAFDRTLSHEITHLYQDDNAYIKNLLKRYLKDFDGDKIAMQNALASYINYNKSDESDNREAYKKYLKSPKEYQARVVSTARSIQGVVGDDYDNTISMVTNIVDSGGDDSDYSDLSLYSDFMTYYRMFKNSNDNFFEKFKRDVKKLIKR